MTVDFTVTLKIVVNNRQTVLRFAVVHTSQVEEGLQSKDTSHPSQLGCLLQQVYKDWGSLVLPANQDDCD